MNVVGHQLPRAIFFRITFYSTIIIILFRSLLHHRPSDRQLGAVDDPGGRQRRVKISEIAAAAAAGDRQHCGARRHDPDRRRDQVPPRHCRCEYVFIASGIHPFAHCPVSVDAGRATHRRRRGLVGGWTVLGRQRHLHRGRHRRCSAVMVTAAVAVAAAAFSLVGVTHRRG